MANRLVGNLYILDGTGALPYINAKIAAIGFYGVDTTARLTIRFQNSTADSLIAFAPPLTATTVWDKHKDFGMGWFCSDTMNVATLVAGTGWVYLV